MAGLQLRATSGSVALTGGVAKSVIQINTVANQRAKLTYVGVFLDGVTNTAVPVAVRVLRQTTAGTFSNATNVPVIVDKGLTETPQTNFQTVATAEPTAGDVLKNFLVPAFMGSYAEFYPYGQEILIQGGGRIGVECNAPAGVNVRVELAFEE